MKSKILVIVISVLFIGILVFASIYMNNIGNDFAFDWTFGENAGQKSGENNKEEENNMNILELTNENFEEEVLRSDKTVLIDFYADWCMPCKIMAPVVAEIANENESIKVGKINIDIEEELAIKYRVMSIPTFLVIKNGEVVNKIVGAVDKSDLEEAIK